MIVNSKYANILSQFLYSPSSPLQAKIIMLCNLMNFYVETEFLARFVSTASFYRQSSISICIAAGADCSYFNKAITGGEANHFLASLTGVAPCSRRPWWRRAGWLAAWLGGCKKVGACVARSPETIS